MPKLKARTARAVSADKEPAAAPASEAVDDYLKAIFELGSREEREVASTEIAQRLDITGASVTNMLQKLAAAEPPLVIYRKHHGVRLAPPGKRRALEIIRHHRLIETFLTQVLGYPWDEVHQEAERLEHFISERFEERIAAKLGHPEFDPHGHVIPLLDGSWPGARPGSAPAREPVALSQLASGQTARVVSVSDKDPSMLRYLAAQGILPGVHLTVREQLPFKGAWQVQIGRATDTVLLSDTLAAAVLVASDGEPVDFTGPGA